MSKFRHGVPRSREQRAARRLESGIRSALSVGLKFPVVVVVAWVLAAATLSLLATPLATVVERSSTAFLPEDSPTLKGLRVMDSDSGQVEPSPTCSSSSPTRAASTPPTNASTGPW